MPEGSSATSCQYLGVAPRELLEAVVNDPSAFLDPRQQVRSRTVVVRA